MSDELPSAVATSTTELLIPSESLRQSLQFGVGAAIMVGVLEAASAVLDAVNGPHDGWHLSDTLAAVAAVVAIGILRAFWGLGQALENDWLRRLAVGVFASGVLVTAFSMVGEVDLPDRVKTGAVICLSVAAIAVVLYTFGPTFREMGIAALFGTYIAVKIFFRGGRRIPFLRGMDAGDQWLLGGVVVGLLAILLCHLCFGITVLRARTRLGPAASAFGWTQIGTTVALTAGAVWLVARIWRALDNPNLDPDDFNTVFATEIQLMNVGRLISAGLAAVTTVWLFRSIHSRAAVADVG